MKLSSEQKLAFKWLDDGENFFITGGAGCGKSYLIDAIAKSEQIYKQMTVTASTGIAAYLLNGSTVHSFAGIETGTKSDDYYVRYMHPEVHKRWLQTDVLIIDEISMINAETFDLLHRLGCKIRKCEDELFGGIQVIVCGDFYQLKPIVGNYAFQSSIWKQYIVKVFNLTTCFRQKDDLQFFNALNELRLGQVSADSIEYLTIRHFIDEDSINDEYTRLFFRNLSVQFYNQKKMKDIKHKEFTFYSKDVIRDPKASALFRIHQVLTVKVNAIVMLIKNINVEEGLCNGAIGKVIQIENDGVWILMNNREIKIEAVNEDILDNAHSTIASRVGIPLQLAFLLTVHKAQGSTMKKIVLNFNENAFNPTLYYVSLSRVCNINDVYILHKNKDQLEKIFKNIKINQLVNGYYQQFVK
ncbi:ATP-dependent DNA helicase PIF1-like [Hydra vulgaris]|uniref:ATP-dependent DNA helicase n=1 Tax=Hydra vulgaris TaxID=6087 RepID=A0ABM4B8P4_HYDVU